MIHYGKHNVNEDDVAAVCDVLRNENLTQDHKGIEFEAALCQYTGARYCITVNSATSALHIACLALGIGENDTVWTSPNSFVASANCALYSGARVDFVDIHPISRNIDINALNTKLAEAKRSDQLPKAIIVVHFAGNSCEMKELQQLLQPLDIALIEDASHALGGTYLDKPVGNCEFSNFCVFSFHPVKSMTTGEGGALMVNCPDLAKNARLYAKHGITRTVSDYDYFTGQPWEYEQQVLGFNYRLSDIQSALGISQLNRLDSFIAKRRALVARYNQLLADLPLKLPVDNPQTESAWHLYVVELRNHEQRAVYDYMLSKGVQLNVHYIPIHLQPHYRRLGFSPGDFPVAEKYYKMALTLPLYPDLTESQQDFVVATLKEALD
ncbi:UDP-4-amino-4,6-dideoxy-N-acetyl-beta-L-altrosamine transaminase [Planctobacterium marinum]|uniref:UDP-4-amino-4,6-dideoxy-N-acetyl-beta-L-altrosami ne transaminase n=1 Tax=Planctobacterium marinum TaxID=1631968 RepID=A0AA48I035_9ALTE|nr:UDP-4-amino-4,6-dideoxy-N-acetyl-beta-L-altrosami ne transaminase [Planctobacterium marinum]